MVVEIGLCRDAIEKITQVHESDGEFVEVS